MPAHVLSLAAGAFRAEGLAAKVTKSPSSRPGGTGPLDAAAGGGFFFFLPAESGAATGAADAEAADAGAAALTPTDSKAAHAATRELAFSPFGPTYVVYRVPDGASRRFSVQPSGRSGFCAAPPPCCGRTSGAATSGAAPGLELEPAPGDCNCERSIREDGGAAARSGGSASSLSPLSSSSELAEKSETRARNMFCEMRCADRALKRS